MALLKTGPKKEQLMYKTLCLTTTKQYLTFPLSSCMISINQNWAHKKPHQNTVIKQGLLFPGLSQTAWSLPPAGDRLLLIQPMEKQSALLNMGDIQSFCLKGFFLGQEVMGI